MHQLAASSRAVGNEEQAQEFARAAEPCFSGTYSYRTPISAEALQVVAPEHRLFNEPTMVYVTVRCKIRDCITDIID